MLTELHNNEFMTRVFLCKYCWKILSNFYKKETSIKECFRQTLVLLPTIACREQDPNSESRRQNPEVIPDIYTPMS